MAANSTTAQAAPQPAKRALSIFRFSEGPALQDVPVMKNNSPQSVNAFLGEAREAGLGEGFEARCLFHLPEPNGFSLSHGWFKSNSSAPPHTHNKDCLYYILAGEMILGSETLTTGDGMFVPADTAYSFVAGPEGVEFLEFRASSEFDVNIREAPPQAWSRMLSIVAANRENWRTEQPPSGRGA